MMNDSHNEQHEEAGLSSAAPIVATILERFAKPSKALARHEIRARLDDCAARLELMDMENQILLDQIASMQSSIERKERRFRRAPLSRAAKMLNSYVESFQALEEMVERRVTLTSMAMSEIDFRNTFVQQLDQLDRLEIN